MFGRRKSPKPETQRALEAVEYAKQEHAESVARAAEAEEVAERHRIVRRKNHLGPAFAAEYGRLR